MIYLFIFTGSYVLFFVASALYVLVTRNNAAAICRELGMSEEMIEARLNADEWRGWSLARRSTMVNGTAFGFLIALTYTGASLLF